jgi:outer membrane protein OmpA-like peptidoglycan-associated protein
MKHMLRALVITLVVLLGLGQGAMAQSGPFSGGWTLQGPASSLRFQSVKNEVKVESSQFATYSGQIAADGTATVSVNLDSVDTKIDLRNVRMRFLFFETFQYPLAVITTKLNAADFADLAQVRRKVVTLPYSLELHGVTKAFEAEVVVTYLSDDLVAISSGAPIAVAAADFNLTTGIEKLQEAAGVRIIPSATVSFDFMFARNTGAAPVPVVPVPAAPAKAALETAGNFDTEACKGRFEILSRAGSIYFRSGSAQLDAKSAPLLDNLADIVLRCPGMVVEVSGHTDSDGSSSANLRLSEQRAAAVAEFLVGKGVDAARFTVVGRGESMPVVPNDTASNKARNRRIEFKVVNG